MRLVIADDRPDIVRAVLRLLVTPEFDVMAIVKSGHAAVESILALKPDCAVLDISMPDFSGIEVARRVKAAGSNTKVVFLTIHEDPDFVDEAVAAGGLGYVVKSRMGLDLRNALRCALSGARFLSPSIKVNPA